MEPVPPYGDHPCRPGHDPVAGVVARVQVPQHPDGQVHRCGGPARGPSFPPPPSLPHPSHFFSYRNLFLSHPVPPTTPDPNPNPFPVVFLSLPPPVPPPIGSPLQCGVRHSGPVDGSDGPPPNRERCLFTVAGEILRTLRKANFPRGRGGRGGGGDGGRRGMSGARPPLPGPGPTGQSPWGAAA